MIGPPMYPKSVWGNNDNVKRKENIKMFGKIEKYRLKMVGPLMYLSLCEGRPPPRLICRLPDSCLATGGHCRSEAAVIILSSSHPYRHHIIITLPYYYESSTRHGHTTSLHWSISGYRCLCINSLIFFLWGFLVKLTGGRQNNPTYIIRVRES